MTAFRVLIIDDHPIIRQGMAQIIAAENGFAVCGEAGSLHTGLELAKREQPDVALVDVRLPDGSGLQLVKELLRWCPKVRVLVMSAQDEQVVAERAMRAGALGYVDKSRPVDELLDALLQVAQGKPYVMQSSRLSGHAATHDGLALLSDRELEVFELVGSGLKNKEIGERLHVSPKTIETHKRHIQEKLRLTNYQELLQVAHYWLTEGELKGDGRAA